MGTAGSVGQSGSDESTQSAHRVGDEPFPYPMVRSVRLLLGVSLLIVSALLLSSTAARAARVHPLVLRETLPEEQDSASEIAVSQATHHFYSVVSNPFTKANNVYNFEANGTIDPSDPKLITPPGFNPFRVAVDNSGGSHDGYIYVTDNESGAVQQFTPTGSATAVSITAAAIPSNGTPQGGGLPPVVNTGEFKPRNIAVGPAGNIFVTEDRSKSIEVFSPTGAFVAQLGVNYALPFPPTFASRIALDAAGDIYLALAGEFTGLYELDPSGECMPASCEPIDPTPIDGVTIDRSTGQIYTTGSVGGEGVLSEYEADGTLLGITRPKELKGPSGIGIDESTGNIIIAADPGVESTIQIYGPVEVVPDITTLAPESVTDHSATLKGVIGAAGLTGVTCVFQYVDQEAFEAGGFEGAEEAPCQPGGPFSGTTMEPVHAEVTDLRGGTTYHERIVGESTPGELEQGANFGEDIPFVTLGPTIAGAEATAVTETAATLKGTVDPDNSPTTYHFEYLTQAQFEVAGWAGATEVPAGGASVGSGNTAVPVSAVLEGLSPRTAYRFRIVAISGAGISEGAGIVFITQGSPSAGLPDGRRYEQVSPVAKNGANIQGGLNSVQASLDGERITFFSNTGIPGGEGAQEFQTYMAQRSTGGWTTRGLLPPASYGPRASVVGWTEDLKDTYDFATQPFEEGRLVRRQSSTAALTEVGRGSTSENLFSFAGSSQNGEVALLETAEGGLLPGKDLVGKQNVYVYGRESGTLSVAGVLNPTTPGGEPTVPPGGAMAGPYDWFQFADTNLPGGVAARYFTQFDHAISADGTKVFFTAGGTGQLYVRINPLAPQSAMAGEGCTEVTKACTVRVSAPEAGITDPAIPAVFVGASADGRFVYFLDKGKLTANATGGSGRDLYRYDVSTGELLDLSVDAIDKTGARVEGMLAIGGPAGEDAYFVAAGQLASDATQAPSGETNLYALHGTAISFVTRLGTGRVEAVNWIPSSKFQEGGEFVTHASRLSADGQTLLFSSARQLTSYDSHGNSELYLDSVAGITCISCNPTGEAPVGSAGVQNIPPTNFNLFRHSYFITRNLSTDGKRVFFDTADPLVSADHNVVNDVYEWEAPVPGEEDDTCTTGSPAYVPSSKGCLFLISGGAEGDEPSWFGDASASGDDVFFFTAQPLVAQDKDELVDVYDARVGGGIGSQESVPPPPCEGEAGCRGPGSSSPVSPAPGTSSFSGPGNTKPKTCKKGQVHKGGRCVKKHRSKQKKKTHHGKKKSHHGQRKGGGR